MRCIETKLSDSESGIPISSYCDLTFVQSLQEEESDTQGKPPR
jgi:hypothetical protein